MKPKTDTERKPFEKASSISVGSCFSAIPVLPETGGSEYPSDIEAMLVDVRARILHFRAESAMEKHSVDDLSD